MSNAALSDGTSATANGYDYYWDVDQESLMRAEPNGSEAPVPIVGQEHEYGCICSIAAYDDYVFYVQRDYSGEDPDVLYRTCSDGSGTMEIYSIASDLPEGSRAIVDQVNVFDGRLYFAVRIYVSVGDDSTSGIMVARTDLEGYGDFIFDEQRDFGSVTVGPDCLYYAVDGTVYLRNYDDEESVELYRSPWERTSAPVPYCGRVYFLETYENADGGRGARLTSVRADGSDARFIDPNQAGDAFSLLAVADGKAYVQLWDGYAGGGYRPDVCGVAAVSLADGSPVGTIALEPSNGYPRMTDAGGRLLAVITAVDSSGAAYGAYSLEYDGSILKTYKAYPYADGAQA